MMSQTKSEKRWFDFEKQKLLFFFFWNLIFFFSSESIEWQIKSNQNIDNIIVSCLGSGREGEEDFVCLWMWDNCIHWIILVTHLIFGFMSIKCKICGMWFERLISFIYILWIYLFAMPQYINPKYETQLFRKTNDVIIHTRTHTHIQFNLSINILQIDLTEQHIVRSLTPLSIYFVVLKVWKIHFTLVRLIDILFFFRKRQKNAKQRQNNTKASETNQFYSVNYFIWMEWNKELIK